MTLDEKIDYLIEMVEDVQSKLDNQEEDLEELLEKVVDLGTPFGDGFDVS